jgi:hypothetical protein
MPANNPAITPVAPMPTGQAVLPHTGQTLFSARAPAKIDHHPAKRSMPEVMIFLPVDCTEETSVSEPVSGAETDVVSK